MVEALATNRAQTGWVWLTAAGGDEENFASPPNPATPAAHPHARSRPAGLRWVKPEMVHWKSGPFTIEGLLYLPPDAGSSKVPSSSMSTAARSALLKTAMMLWLHSSSVMAGPFCAPIRAARPITASNLAQPTRTTSAAAIIRM